MDGHLQRISDEAFCRCIMGSAKSMGIRIVDDSSSNMIPSNKT